MDSEQEDDAAFWASFGDIRSMQEVADRLQPEFGPIDVTPWGLTLHTAERGDVAVIGVEGRGTFHIAVVLPPGYGARAARKQAPSVFAWFHSAHDASWAQHGFTDARLAGPMAVAYGGGMRWAVMIAVSFATGADLTPMMRWARDHGAFEYMVR